MLYIISTPIGHLEDITARALKALQECEAILCEDTRRASILLQKYQIEKPLILYHRFKEKTALAKVLQRLQEGQNLALISDAGTPCINDPGHILVEACIEHKIPFTALPGACSVIQALILSGFSTERFQFVGFLPRKPKETLRSYLCYPGTTVCFESPERIVKTLQILDALDPKRELAVAREMTKTFEECRRGDPKTLYSHFEKTPPKGEIVLLIAEGSSPTDEMDLDELIETLQNLHGLSLKDAIKQAAKLKKVSKRTVYNQCEKRKI